NWPGARLADQLREPGDAERLVRIAREPHRSAAVLASLLRRARSWRLGEGTRRAAETPPVGGGDRGSDLGIQLRVLAPPRPPLPQEQSLLPPGVRPERRRPLPDGARPGEPGTAPCR